MNAASQPPAGEHQTTAAPVLWLGPLGLALLLVSGVYLWHGGLRLQLQDGGFLWYGAVRTAMGEVPLRDFQAYDPGRYYWLAPWSVLLGDGVLAVRLGAASFQALALWGVLVAARLTGLGWASIVLLACTLTAWAFPWFKTFEAGVALICITVLTVLIRRPSLAMHFAAGVTVGAVGMIGRNLGAYAAATSLFSILLVHQKQGGGRLTAKGAAWALGVVLGYTPVLALLAFVPGFFESYVDSARLYLELGSSNISRPVPWLWNLDAWSMLPPDYASLPFHARWPWIFLGLTWILLPVSCVAGLAAALLTRGPDLERRALFIASAAVSLPFVHFAFSRADLFHMAPALLPVFVGAAALPAGFFRARRRAFSIGLAVLALPVLGAGLALKTHTFSSVAELVEVRIRGDSLALDWYTAAIVRTAVRVHARYVQPGQSLLILPHAPGLYAALGIRSPIWEIYATVPPTRRVLDQMIPSLEANHVDWILFADSSVDDREDLRLEHTHPEFWRYFTEHFEPLPGWPVPPPYRFYRRVVGR